MVYVVAAVLGLVFGSFANVLIWRVPRGESIVAPPSHCPSCDGPIAWYDNVPVISWFMLRGRCRRCGAAIPVRYPLVEVVSGLLAVAAVVAFGPTVRGVLAGMLFYLLLVLSAIDLGHLRLPNPLVAALAVIGIAGVVGSAAGLAALPLVGPPGQEGVRAVVLALSGCVLGLAITVGISGAYRLIRGRTGLGMGDVKLLAVLGLYVGPYVLMVLLLGSILGALWGVTAGRSSSRTRGGTIPFGPFLAMGAVITALVGERVLAWYLGIVGLL